MLVFRLMPGLVHLDEAYGSIDRRVYRSLTETTIFLKLQAEISNKKIGI